MRRRLDAAFAQAILWTAARLVPRCQRQDWFAEWRGEVFQIQRTNRPTCEATRFAAGALQDAFWLRCESISKPSSHTSALGEPRACLAALGTLSAIAVLAVLLIPALRRQILPLPTLEAEDFQPLSLNPSFRDSDLLVAGRDYFSWRNSRPFTATRSIYYQPAASTLQIDSKNRDLTIAWIEDHPFILGAEQTSSAVQTAQGLNVLPLILSYGLWKRQFYGNSSVVGQQVLIGSKRAIIVAIAPQWASELPGSIDAWVFCSPQKMRTIEAQRFAYGYILMRKPSSLTGDRKDGDVGDVIVEHLSRETVAPTSKITLSGLAREHHKLPLQIFLKSTKLAMLVTPFLLLIWPVSFESFPHSRRVDGRFIGFFILKILLLFPVAYCIPLEVAELFTGISPDATHCLQAFLTFAMVLISVHWCLRDQSQRCPNCLRRFSHPAYVGQSSRSLLAWSGMELICRNGHGLLHVPNHATSWFPGASWLKLDSSWQNLFQP
ncbi:hypothetical protein [Silvibacterium acidisoli]|uniref:hypothetical protein n=1 Tax=Acidobacteriaceae bacterium ZG23-2 TaxID=2883246 RepID=UPI00406D2FF4